MSRRRPLRELGSDAEQLRVRAPLADHLNPDGQTVLAFEQRQRDCRHAHECPYGREHRVTR